MFVTNLNIDIQISVCQSSVYCTGHISQNILLMISTYTMINDQSIENIIVIRTEYHFCGRLNANYVCLYLNGQIKKSMSFNLLVTSITPSVGLLAHRAPGERHHEKSWIWYRWKNCTFKKLKAKPGLYKVGEGFS